MKKLLYSCVAAAALTTGGALWLTAQDGVTPGGVSGSDQPVDMTLLITNPSFESYVTADHNSDKVVNSSDGLRGWTCTAPEGWKVTGNHGVNVIITKDCYTDNNFGLVTTVPDGNNAYYLRMGWENGASTLSQTIAQLPAGNFTLSFDYRAIYNGSATSSFEAEAGTGTLAETPFSAGSAGIMTTAPWKTASVTFNHAQAGPCEIAVNVNWVSGGSCIMVDNFKLVRNGEAGIDPTPEIPEITSPTEGVITHDFVAEPNMKDDILQMLANFTTYIKNDYQACTSPNSVGEECGCFKGENTMANNEQGVRPNADLSMICAFLAKYAKGKVTLPANVTWNDIEDLAMKSLVFAYSTHKANKLKVCSGNNYWGSTSKNDAVWESSLWAMSVAYSAFFQWDKLSAAQKDYIKAMLVAECNYELERTIPTGYQGDTKAEENGWEVDVLAVTLGLFPEHELAPKWFERMREFAINSYSHTSDASDNTVIDPDYNTKTVADLYKGANLYDDYTLQNHNLFHTSYQNVVMQELGEAALGLKLFQKELYNNEKWKSNALMHNNQKVMDEVLNWLALADGELAMPNGNDWSLFLFDQITSYSTMACFLKDPNALFLENMAYKFIKARQSTTEDGSWLLRADVGARRMGVEAHRVMMTWLMHEANSTADVEPVTWEAFRDKYAEPKFFPCQNVVRSISPSRFTCFSWSQNLKSYTGYLTSNNPDNNKIVVPYRENNTGNFIGWYTVSGKTNGATPVVSGVYDLRDDSYVMNGELSTNAGTLDNRFVIYATPGNAVIYLDNIYANKAVTITGEYGGLMAISTDAFTKEKRTLYSEASANGQVLDGSKLTTIETGWLNIDNELGFVTPGHKMMAFGNRANNNSIMTSKLYTLYSKDSREVEAMKNVDRRSVVYYTSVDAAETKNLAEATKSLIDKVPEGWNGIIAPDPDGVSYLLLANFLSMEPCSLTGVTLAEGAPVFSEYTTIVNNASEATFVAQLNHSHADVLDVFVKGTNLLAVKDAENPASVYVTNQGNESTPAFTFIVNGEKVTGDVKIAAGATLRVYVSNGRVLSEVAAMPAVKADNLTEGYVEVTANYFKNTGFEEDQTYSAVGKATASGTDYDPCYLNEVPAANTNWPNVLPVKGWTPGNGLEGGSKYCRMYSMPYSTTQFCVSPSSVGNYAALCPPIVGDAETGKRCLTVLNSWDKGNNKISQTAKVPDGKYRLLINAKYECPNESSNDGKVIEAGGNTNTSLTGVKFGDTELYAYPSRQNEWETLVYDFELAESAPIEISMGYHCSDSKGAASNTVMYLDNVRLYRYGSSGIEAVELALEAQNVYNLNGILVRKAGDTAALAPGIYIIGNRKVAIK